MVVAPTHYERFTVEITLGLSVHQLPTFTTAGMMRMAKTMRRINMIYLNSNVAKYALSEAERLRLEASAEKLQQNACLVHQPWELVYYDVQETNEQAGID